MEITNFRSPYSYLLLAAKGFPFSFCGWKPQDPIAAL
jgi:hypothetical protein